MPFCIAAHQQPRHTFHDILESLNIQCYADWDKMMLMGRQGMTMYQPKNFPDKPYIIVVDPYLPSETIRMVLAHELAHIILGHVIDYDRERLTQYDIERREFEAESLGFILYSYITNPFYGSSDAEISPEIYEHYTGESIEQPKIIRTKGGAAVRKKAVTRKTANEN